MHWEMLEIREVEAIQPNHRAVAVFAVVMPVPGWGENYVSTLHFDPPTMHCGKPTLALDNKSHGKSDMSVSLCRLIWHYEL